MLERLGRVFLALFLPLAGSLASMRSAAPAPAAPAQGAPPTLATWYSGIGALVAARCGACHDDDGPAPVAFALPADLASRADKVRDLVGNGLMPPFPVHAVSPLKNDPRLTDDERAALLRWLDAGSPIGEAPRGETAAATMKRWRLGAPDFEESFAVPSGNVGRPEPAIAQLCTLTLRDDTRVSGIELAPEDARGLRNLCVWSRPSAEAAWHLLAVWSPLEGATVEPPDAARTLRRGTQLFANFVAARGAAPEHVAARLALRYARGEPARTVTRTDISGAGMTFSKRAELLRVLPASCLPGLPVRVKLVAPNGKIRVLFEIGRWDPVLVSAYEYVTPVTIPEGSTLRADSPAQIEVDWSTPRPEVDHGSGRGHEPERP